MDESVAGGEEFVSFKERFPQVSSLLLMQIENQLPVPGWRVEVLRSKELLLLKDLVDW